MRILIALLLAGLASAADRLTVRFIDVEGGQAMLIVAPTGESMLVDAGSGEQDAQRIQKAVHDAGLTRIHYLLLTNFHRDHAGGAVALSKLVPIVAYLDHGASSDTSPGAQDVFSAYWAVARGRRRGVYAGDTIPLGAADINILTANGDRISESLPGGGQINLLCGSDKQRPPERNEDTQSIGILLTFGRFRMLDFSDLLWNQEIDFVCPVNRIGTVTAYVTTHHGEATSGPQTLVHAVRPVIAIMNNGPEKGGAPETLKVLQKSPGIQAVWELHSSAAAGPANPEDRFIANPDGKDGGFGLLLSVARTGEFSVTNERTGKTESYAAR
jgi:beta-lactamase superfamily II metal-dependent hydrolase